MALALDQRKDRHFVGWRQESFAGRLAAHVGLINFDGDASAPEPVREDAAIFGHGFADTMAKKPSGFHAAIEHALDLPGRDAFLAGAHQVDDLEPQVERQVAILEKRAHADREGLLAGVALVQPRPGRLAIQAANAGGFATVRANGAIRPQTRLDVSESGALGEELGFIQNGLSHGKNSYGSHTSPWRQVCQV